MEARVLVCQVCRERPVQDALEIERFNGPSLVMGCVPCLRRLAMRPHWRLSRLPQILMLFVRALALPWITPTIWLREALFANGWSLEEFRARQAGRLVASEGLNPDGQVRLAGDLIVLLRFLAAADGSTSREEWQAIRRSVFAQHVESPSIWKEVDPGPHPLPAPSRAEWQRACRRLRPLIHRYDQRLFVHWVDVVLEASDGLMQPEQLAVGEVVSALGLDADLFARKFGAPVMGEVLEGSACPYQTLGVPTGASKREIRRAYLKLAMENHPDRVARLGPSIVKAANERMKQINRAYETLKR